MATIDGAPAGTSPGQRLQATIYLGHLSPPRGSHISLAEEELLQGCRQPYSQLLKLEAQQQE